MLCVCMRECVRECACVCCVSVCVLCVLCMCEFGRGRVLPTYEECSEDSSISQAYSAC